MKENERMREKRRTNRVRKGERENEGQGERMNRVRKRE